MRTTVDIDAELLRRLRQEASRRGVPFKHLLNAVLRQGLGGSGAVRRTRRYRCPSFSMGAPRRGVNLDKALGLAATLEDDEVAVEMDRRT